MTRESASDIFFFFFFSSNFSFIYRISNIQIKKFKIILKNKLRKNSNYSIHKSLKKFRYSEMDCIFFFFYLWTNSLVYHYVNYFFFSYSNHWSLYFLMRIKYICKCSAVLNIQSFLSLPSQKQANEIYIHTHLIQDQPEWMQCSRILMLNVL